MSKVITLRIEDDDYNILKSAAEAERRTISNFIEHAALSHLIEESYVSDEEMSAILNDENLLKSFKRARTDIKKGKYTIVA